MKLKTELVTILGSTTPAQLDMDTGTIYLNAPYWNYLPQAYKDFIIQHETGHYVLKTYNEFEADHYAFEQLAGKRPGSLWKMIETIADVLDGSSPEHYARFAAMYRNVMYFNYEDTGDKKYLLEIERFNREFLIKHRNVLRSR
ncbi:MAG: hypothetical protein K9H26_10740 [Prolixibacteraceae bacterium]|nr:hypothetical protein [Prolixibacteraceae bacterium]